jgi:DNA gyrase subunit A
VLATRDGMAIRFHESDVREMGRATTGVRGIRLRAEDIVVGMVVARSGEDAARSLLVVTEKGRGKRTPVEEYRLQTRGGLGVINFRATEQSGKVVAIRAVSDEHELMLITRNGVVIRQRVAGIREIGRATQGVRIIALDEGDTLVDVAKIVPDEEEEQTIEAGADPTVSLAGEEPGAGGVVEEPRAESEPQDEGDVE